METVIAIQPLRKSYEDNTHRVGLTEEAGEKLADVLDGAGFEIVEWLGGRSDANLPPALADSRHLRALAGDMLDTILKIAAFGVHDSNREALRAYALACRDAVMEMDLQEGGSRETVAPPQGSCPYCTTGQGTSCPWHR